jgi:hypothetical protein
LHAEILPVKVRAPDVTGVLGLRWRSLFWLYPSKNRAGFSLNSQALPRFEESWAAIRHRLPKELIQRILMALPSNWSIPVASLISVSTYDWTARQWSVPLNLIISQLFKVGKQPMQAFVGGRYYVEGPDGGPEWGLRVGLVLLFPK